MANKRNGTADIRKETFNGKNEGTEETKTPEKKYKEKDKELKKQARREKKYTGWSRYNLPKKFWVIRRI
jgi:hypothetical protein